MKQLVIHVGYPKAASTTLQNGLFLALHKTKAVNFLGRAFESDFYGAKQDKDEYKRWFKCVVNDSDPDGVDSLGKLTAHAANLLSEGLFMMNERHCDHIAAPGMLHRHFASRADNIEILIVIRKQENLIPSYYVQNYRWLSKEDRTFSDYLYRNEKYKWTGGAKIFNFHSVVRAYVDVFGKNNVHVLLFEDFIHDRDRFSAKLGTIFNIDADTIKRNLGEVRLNQTRNEGENLVVRKFDKHSVRGKLFRRLEKITPNLADSLRIRLPAVSDEQKRAIFDSFKASNVALAEEFALDKGVMREYGYF